VAREVVLCEGSKICSGGIALPLGANRGPIGRSFEGFDKLRGLA